MKSNNSAPLSESQHIVVPSRPLLLEQPGQAGVHFLYVTHHTPLATIILVTMNTKEGFSTRVDFLVLSHCCQPVESLSTCVTGEVKVQFMDCRTVSTQRCLRFVGFSTFITREADIMTI